MIQTAEECPIYQELGLGPNPTTKDMIKVVAKKSGTAFLTNTVEIAGLYTVIFTLNDWRDKKPINWVDNIYTSLNFGTKLATQVALSDAIGTSIALYRGERKIYDPIVSSAIAGGVVEIPNGYKAVYNGAVNGALWSTAMAGLQYALQKINEATS